MPQPLPDDAIVTELAKRPGWSREGEEIMRTFDRGNFNGSIAFVNAIAAAANAAIIIRISRSAGTASRSACPRTTRTA